MQVSVHPVHGGGEHHREEGGDQEQDFDTGQRPHDVEGDERGHHHADGDGDRAYRYWVRLLEHGQIVRPGRWAVAVWSPLPWASPSPSPRSTAAAPMSCASTSTAA